MRVGVERNRRVAQRNCRVVKAVGIDENNVVPIRLFRFPDRVLQILRGELGELDHIDVGVFRR